MSLNLGKPYELPPNARSARVVEVIQVVTKEGQGTDDDLVREVTRYYTLGGELIATHEPAPTTAKPVHNETRGFTFTNQYGPSFAGLDPTAVQRSVTARARA